LSRLFCQDQDQDQDSGSQDQGQDFIFGPRGASRPRLWSRGLHHCILGRLSPSPADYRIWGSVVSYLLNH